MGALRILCRLITSEQNLRRLLARNQVHQNTRLWAKHSVNGTYSSGFCTSTVDYKKKKDAVQVNPKAKTKPHVIEVWRNMTVKELANTMDKSIDHIFEVFVYVDNSAPYRRPNSVIHNFAVIQETAKKSGFRFKVVPHPSERVVDEGSKHKDAVKRPPADPSKLVKRPPVVTIMGHVDHGKTTLLDSLRNTKVVDSEFGGITQHIGAFSVALQNKDRVTFLDTPGHAAFTAMRARGADATDIVVLVVAADDGVMEQTVESIRMAKESNVPIIVAINKIDKPQADIGRTKKMLLNHGIQLEDFGGEVQSVPISALKGTNLKTLVEAIALQAEIMDLKAEPVGYVEGIVIESRTDPGRGKLSTALVQRGTLRKGCFLVAGNAWAKVRAMFDDAGRPLNEALPSTPVEILGWRELPSAGDEIIEVESEKIAQDVMKFRQEQKKEQQVEEIKEVLERKSLEHQKVYQTLLEEKRKIGWYRFRRKGPREKEFVKKDEGPELNILVKGDVDGSVEAILDVLETYDEERQCKLSLIHYGVGMITENDIELASAFDGMIYTFNLKTPPRLMDLARQKSVSVKPHNVIYKLVDDIKDEVSSRLPLKKVEDSVGEANVLQFFEITDGKKKVGVAGSRCIKGMLKKSTPARVIRNGEIIYEGTVYQLRHLKNEVDSVKKDVECGIRLDKNDLQFEPGDIIQCYTLRDETQKCEWDPGF
ncbi:translation initiation factor IF-2, mitochondrial [Neocloeon triangulifer]|uniref:translation initiation factor IF-2, mitochondrial n=1 Tax=Neocloeon triangulifer TaxID=2078957 RepID=UPI00286F2158|nr:translation initiation factor IF-2, mitochondrial [Neocloeon triangulifer]